MTLPPRAVHALVALRRELLASSISPSTEKEKQEAGIRSERERKTPERRMRHARSRNTGFQIMCRRRGRG
jgi:hypothetical protein